jgi:tRNA-dihydrouridine synthase A
MMEWTDRHCRVLHRGLTRHARLYTEMVTAEAVIRGDRARLLGFDPEEHPLALQLGGAEPARLAEAARIGAEFGYDEINLNVGCPSDRVQSGRFGACLMREPMLVAECVAAMKGAVDVPVTVKCRIGVDDQDPEESLRALVAACAAAGVQMFAVHARKAWLEGVSPKDNRDLPPLDYDLVYRLKRENPALTIVLNGGIATLDQAEEHLRHVDGVMMGRAAYQTPALLADIDRRFFASPSRGIDDAIENYADYVARQIERGVPLNAMTRHMLGLFNGRPGARRFRRFLSENATKPNSGVATLRAALAYLSTETREASPQTPVATPRKNPCAAPQRSIRSGHAASGVPGGPRPKPWPPFSKMCISLKTLAARKLANIMSEFSVGTSGSSSAAQRKQVGVSAATARSTE